MDFHFKGGVTIEPINDNGPRPHNYPPPVTTKKRGLIPLIVVLLILGMLAAFMMFSVAVFAVRHYNISTSNSIHTNVAVVEVTETRRNVRHEFPNLSVIRNTGSLSHGDMYLDVGDINQLNITMRNGGLTFTVHEKPYIWIHSPGGTRYDFSDEQQTLAITARNSPLFVFIPYNRLEAIFEDISINGRNGSISIWGTDDNVFLSENLRINSRNGTINLGDVVISSYLDLETHNANINLHNVIADADRLSIATRNGRVNISE